MYYLFVSTHEKINDAGRTPGTRAKTLKKLVALKMIIMINYRKVNSNSKS